MDNIEKTFEKEKKFTTNLNNEIKATTLEFHDDFKGSGKYKIKVLQAFLEDGIKEITGEIS